MSMTPGGLFRRIAAFWSGRELPLGERGERLAARWLARRGYRIVERNLTIGRDEADLVALAPDGALVIVEVKTRSSAGAWPEDAIDARKRRRLARLASRLHQRRAFRDRPLRFDVLSVVWPPDGEPEVRHFCHAFEARR